jgi:DNA-binding NarL/FixJ family response regulator
MTGEENLAIGPAHVLLVAQPLMSWGLERLLESDHGRWSIVGVAASAAEAVLRLELITPDVIVFDLDGEEGTESLAHLQSQTEAHILALTSSRDAVLQDSAVLAGARGVVGKYEAPFVLLRALEKITAGEMWLERGATGRIFSELSRHQEGRWRTSRRSSVSALTPKEKLTVEALASDAAAPGKVIAQRLNISEHTLRNHLTSIYRKLSVSNRAELHAYVKRHGVDRLA